MLEKETLKMTEAMRISGIKSIQFQKVNFENGTNGIYEKRKLVKGQIK